MIPKIIHRVWISNNPMPENTSICFNSQNKLEDYGYEIKTYNVNNFDMSKSNYLLQAYAMKKWAFVSDYIRLYVLYENGGIWLDSDVEVYKPFDELLDQHYFCSVEYSIWNGHENIMNPSFDFQDWGVFGVEPHNQIIGEMLQYYNSIDFIGSDGWIYDKIDPRDGIHETCTINGNYERLLQRLGKKRVIVSDSLKHYKELVNRNQNDVIYNLNTKWLAFFHYNPDVNYNEDVICVHRRQGKWLDDTQRIMYFDDYDDETKQQYYETINKYRGTT